jgi:hypothetical protein
MQSEIRLLDQVRIEEPCSAAWEEMTPVEGDRVRHCSHCQLNVHNLSEMSREEAEELLRRSEGRLCVQYAQRTDGKILTNDHPRLRGIRIVALKQWATAASVVAALSGLFVAGSARADRPAEGKKPAADKKSEPKAQEEEIVRGEIALPPQNTANKSSAVPKRASDDVARALKQIADEERPRITRGRVLRVPLPNRAPEAKAGAKKDVPVFLGRPASPQPKPPVLKGKPAFHPQTAKQPNGKPPVKPTEDKK